jgi:hypothetical protein
MYKTVRLILLGFFLITVYSQEMASYEIYGYFKYLFSTFEMPYLEGRFYDHLLHARLNSRWYPTNDLTGALELRARGYYGDSVEKYPGYKESVTTEYEFNNLGGEVFSTERSFAYLEIDRLYFDYQISTMNITLGRQRIAWGTSLVWNVIDLFNPMSILDFDYEELPAADAARVQYYTGPVSKLEVAYKPAKDIYATTVAGLWAFNSWQYDFFLIAALVNNRRAIGGAWSGAIQGGGFRGEVLLSDPPQMSFEYPDAGNIYLTKNNTMITFVLSGDYTYSNSLYLHSEVLFNNYGVKEDGGPYFYQALAAGIYSPACWSLFQEVSYDITPLLRGSFFLMYNPYDFSALIAPSLSYSLTTNIELLFMGYLTAGSDVTEFGSFGNYLFTRLKYSF